MQSIISVLSSEIPTVFPVIFYPVKFTVELWIENKDMASIFDDFLPAGTGALSSGNSVRFFPMGIRRKGEPYYDPFCRSGTSKNG